MAISWGPSRFRSNRSTAVCRAFSPNRWRRAGSAASRAMAAARAAGSPGDTPMASWSGVNNSTAPPAALTMTGRAQAIASAMVRPKGSGWVLAWTTISRRSTASDELLPAAASCYLRLAFDLPALGTHKSRTDDKDRPDRPGTALNNPLYPGKITRRAVLPFALTRPRWSARCWGGPSGGLIDLLAPHPLRTSPELHRKEEPCPCPLTRR